MIPMMLAVALLSAPGDPGNKVAPTPNPDLMPDRVIEIQLEALQHNDVPTRDAGIATTFGFASPGNRKATGPLDRFAQIVKGPGYRPMIGHRIAGYGKLTVAGDTASRRVTIVADDGKAYEYEFRLSKDPESRCWFTDGVVPIPDTGVQDKGNIALATF